MKQNFQELRLLGLCKLKIVRLKKIGIILFVVGVIYFLIFSPYGLVKILQIRWQIYQIQQEMNILRAKKIALKHEIKLLEQDTSYIRKVAQEKFGVKMGGLYERQNGYRE